MFAVVQHQYFCAGDPASSWGDSESTIASHADRLDVSRSSTDRAISAVTAVRSAALGRWASLTQYTEAGFTLR
ncbi:hypothetical protein [Nocardia brevicatena]|uniref:hypothetical protein n=1 Tax=Nocardia brevicatena TaxID=37327 RepID=UPI0003129B7D|nr:hypothetical protein [Nocardia brevicatena]